MVRALFATLLLVLFAAQGAFAAPVAPRAFEAVQPDGKTFLAVPQGDEFVSWTETLDGYPVVKENGVWYFAQVEGGRLAATRHAVGMHAARSADLGLTRNVGPLLTRRPALEPIAADGLEAGQPSAPNRTRSVRAPGESTVQPLLVIMAEYDNSDHRFSHSASDIEDLIFTGANSVKNYYLENSYGQFSIRPAVEDDSSADGIVEVRLGGSHPNPGTDTATSRAMVEAAITAADAHVDFASYDTDGDGNINTAELGILVIFAKYENAYGGSSSLQPRIWAHVSSPSVTVDGKTIPRYATVGEMHGSTGDNPGHLATIGVICHELGHLFYHLPDLYDTDGSSSGIGDWGMMGGGSWNYVSGYIGSSPAHFSAWSKVAAGLSTAEDIYTQRDMSLVDVENNARIKRMWIDPYMAGEAFMLENRQPEGYDAGLPADGLLIWHTDGFGGDNTNDQHRLVDLEEANGQNNLDFAGATSDAGDVFPGSSNVTIFDETTTPNSNDYGGIQTKIEVSSISASSATMSMHVNPEVPDYKGNLSYANNRLGSSLTYGTSTCYSLLEISNDTTHTQIEGFDVFAPANASVSVEFYDDFVDPTPYYASSGPFSVTGGGWNRIMLGDQPAIPTDGDLVMMLTFTTGTGQCPIAFERTRTPSGGSYITAGGSPLEISHDYGELRQRVLVAGGVRPEEIIHDDGGSSSEDDMLLLTIPCLVSQKQIP
jgi:M6 family metalloprotease-like protein